MEDKEKATKNFNKVYDECIAKVYAYFSICFDSFTAEDLSQQTFMKIWQYLKNHNNFEPDVWTAWVFRAAINVKNDFLRKKQKYKNNTIECKYLESETTDSEYSVSSDTDMTSTSIITALSVEKAFSDLSEEQQEILMLKNFGFTVAEIALQYNLTEPKMRTKINNAKKSFSKNLKDCGVNDCEYGKCK